MDMGGEYGTAIISIRHSKTTSRAARLQSALIDDAPVVALMQRVCGNDPPTSLLLRGGLKEFYRKFEAIRVHLQVASTPFTPATLRGGGATWYIRQTQSLSLLQWKGRWTSEKSVHHYLQLNLGAVAFAALAIPVKLKIRELAELASVVLDPERMPAVNPLGSSTALRATRGKVGEWQSALHTSWIEPVDTYECRAPR
eukprot:1334639-Amphidinium_carterae.1